MKRRLRQRLFVLAGQSLLFSAVLGNNKQKHKECGIYLAPSTIPGAGLGMFAGNRDYEEEDILTRGDLVIPIFELDWHNGFHDYNFLWDEYTWSSSMFEVMEDEIEDAESMNVASPGMGAAVNCMLPLVNAVDAEGEDDYVSDNLGIDNGAVTSDSPGVGAFTPYHDRTFEAKKDIPAGQEIYVNYGRRYFSSRKKYMHVPFSEDYDDADQLIEDFEDLIEELPTLSSSVIESLWELISTPNNWWNSRLFYALPSTFTEATEILKVGGTAMLHYNKSIRSLEWLEANGECMDDIYANVSTIPHAGQGAFARRFLPKGSVVAPAPLIHLPNREVVTMFAGKVLLDDNEEPVMVRDVDNPNHYQLLLNYCFGHEDSTLLLCPYGLLTSLINHSHEAPNTKIVWSQKEQLMGHKNWMNKSLSEWGGKRTTGLSFDFVALRDIEVGEEVLIDYGDDWESAWQEHVKNFESTRPSYIPAFELNRMTDLRVQTRKEYSYKKDGVLVFCRRSYILIHGIDIDDPDDWEGYDEYPDDESLGVYPCRALQRNEDNSYVVELIEADEYQDADLWQQEEEVLYILFDVPRDIFYFKDMAAKRDHHQTWSFRHDMRIPDEIFPEKWKNKIEDSNGEDSANYEASEESSDDDEEEDDDSEDEDEDSSRRTCGMGVEGTCSETSQSLKHGKTISWQKS